MTPEDILQIIENAIEQKMFFPWWSYLLLSIVTGCASYFAVYLNEKGKNLATLEDIAKITDKVEKVKVLYSKDSHSFQIAASGLYKKQAEAIEEIYHLIIETEETFARFVDYEGDTSEKNDLRNEAGELLYKFHKKYKINRIYFSNELCDKLEGFSDSIYKVILPYSIALTGKLQGDDVKDYFDIWDKSKEDFIKQIPIARMSIENEFRRLLNVEEINFQQDGCR